MTELTQQPFAGLDRLLEEKRFVSHAERTELASHGDALPDGSFPIANREDLKNAIFLLPHAKDRAKAEAHIRRHAAALGAEDLLDHLEEKKFAAGSFDPSMVTRAANGQFTSPGGSGGTTGAGGNNSIGDGATGKDVAKLQEYLHKLGLGTGADAKGVFGPGTLQAVRTYQTEHGLKVDGLAGIRTLSSIRDHLGAGASPGHSHKNGHAARTGHGLPAAKPKPGPAAHGGAARFTPASTGAPAGPATVRGGSPARSAHQGKSMATSKTEPAVEYKSVPVGGVQTIDDQTGIVEAIVSVTGVKDRVNDIIQPGSYQKTLADRIPKGVWSHDWDTPTSKTLEAVELMPGDARLPSKTRDGRPWPREAGALLIKMQFNLETQRGREAFSDVKFFGPDQEWSIGYNVPAGAASFERKSGTRNIKELELFEYSPVLFGAMPDAATRSVKSAQAAMKAVQHAMDDEDAKGAEDPSIARAADLDDVSDLTDDDLLSMHTSASEEINREIELAQQRDAEDEAAEADQDADRAEGHIDLKRDGGGNAQTLRDYWAHGKGAAKIAWGTPGDFDRCVAEVDKYMPGQAKGYCNLRHKDALGIYPATHAKLDREGHGDIHDQAKSEFDDNFVPEVKDVSMTSAPGQPVGGFGTPQMGNVPDALSAQSEHSRQCPNCHDDDLVPRRKGGMGCPSCGFHAATADTPFEDVGDARQPYDGAMKSDEATEAKAYDHAEARDEEGRWTSTPAGHTLVKTGSHRAREMMRRVLQPGDHLTPHGMYVADLSGEGDYHFVRSERVDQLREIPGITTPRMPAPGLRSRISMKSDEATETKSAHLPCPKCRSRKATGDGHCADCGAKLASMKSRMSAVTNSTPKGSGEPQTNADPNTLIDNGDPAMKRPSQMAISTKPKDWLPCPNCRKNDPTEKVGRVICGGCGTAIARKTGADSEQKLWSAAARAAALVARRQHHAAGDHAGDHALESVHKHQEMGRSGDRLVHLVARDLHKHEYNKNPRNEQGFRDNDFRNNEAHYRPLAEAAIARHAAMKSTKPATEETKTMTEPQFVDSALPGSMEDLQSRLGQAVDEWAQIEGKSDYTAIEGTWPDYLVFTAYSEKSEEAPLQRTSWQVAFEVNDDGSIDLGEPQQIDAVTMVVPTAVKALNGMTRMLEAKGIDPNLLAAALERVADSQQGLDEIELLEFEALKEFAPGGLEVKTFTASPFVGGESRTDGTHVNFQGKVPAAPAEHAATLSHEGGTGGVDRLSLDKSKGGKSNFEPQQRAARMLADMHDEAKADASDVHTRSDHETAAAYLRLAEQHMAVGNKQTAQEHATRGLSAHDRAMEKDSFGRVGGRAVATLRRFVKADSDLGEDDDTGDVPASHTSGARGHAGNIRGLEAPGEKDLGDEVETKGGKKSRAQEALFGRGTPAATSEPEPAYVEDMDAAALLAEFEALRSE